MKAPAACAPPPPPGPATRRPRSAPRAAAPAPPPRRARAPRSEAILRRPPSDYSRVQRLAEEAEPFRAFWTTAADWRVRRGAARRGAARRGAGILVRCPVRKARAGRACTAAAGTHCCLRARARPQAHHAAWLHGPLSALDPEALGREVAAAGKALAKLGKARRAGAEVARGRWHALLQ